MSLTLQGLMAVTGWTALMLLTFGPGRVPGAVVIGAGASLACCFAFDLKSVAGGGSLDGERADRRPPLRRRDRAECGELRR